MINIKKEYILKQIERVENIIKDSENKIKITNYCTKEEVKNLKTLKNTNNYKLYKEECSKYNISNIQYNYFKNSYIYKNFKKEILLNYLEDIINKAYELKILDKNFSY